MKKALIFCVLFLSMFPLSMALEGYEFVTMWGSCGSGDYQFGVDLGPRGLVADNAGNLCVADYGNQKIKVFSTSGTFEYSFAPGYVGDIDYANGYLYFSKPYGYACKYTVTGTKVWEKYFSAPGWNLGGPCVDSDGNVHFTNGYYNKVYKLDSNTGNLIKEYSVPEGAGHIASDNYGHVYIASGYGPVQRYTNDGVYDNSRLNLSPEERAEGIDVDNQGNIFIGTLNHKMRKYDSNWNLLAEWGEQGSGEGQFSGVGGVTVDNEGYVYLSDGGGANCTGMNRRILVFRPAQPAQVSIVDLLPIQVIEEIDGNDILVDVNDNGIPDLVANKLTAVLLRPSPIPGFTGVIEASLSVKFGEEEVCRFDNLQLEYENGTLAPGIWREDRPYSIYRGESYVVLFFSPHKEGQFQFATTLRDKNGIILHEKIWDQKWEVKTTKDLTIAYYRIDGLSDGYLETYELNDDFIKAIFPLSSSYQGIDAGYINFRYGEEFPIVIRRRLLQGLWNKGKELSPYADKIVGIVPDGWIKEKLGLDKEGYTGYFVNAVFVEVGEETSVSHEIGHTFGMPFWVYSSGKRCLEEYDEGCERDASQGYHPYAKWEMLGVWENFMNTDGDVCTYRDKDYSCVRWINHESYEFLWETLQETRGDPEVVLLTGEIAKHDSVVLGKLLRLREGTPSIMLPMIPSQYSVSQLNVGGQVLFEHPFPVEFVDVSGSTYVETDWGLFTLSLPYTPGATKFVISKGDIVLAELEPLSILLADAIRCVPDSGFVRNPSQLRNALINKVGAFCNIVSVGDTTGAKNKLLNDILKHVQHWLIDDYPVDSLAVPIQVSKAEIIELINTMIPKISWYAHSDGNYKQINPKGELPKELNLAQNYPNPFNPVCNIEYALPTDCHVTLCVYNILGQKVRVLADEYQSAGHKSVKWDGKDNESREVTSGIYFYRLQAGDFAESKKMILLK